MKGRNYSLDEGLRFNGYRWDRWDEDRQQHVFIKTIDGETLTCYADCSDVNDPDCLRYMLYRNISRDPQQPKQREFTDENVFQKP